MNERIRNRRCCRGRVADRPRCDLVAIALAVAILSGCQPADKPAVSKVEPAQVDHHVEESSLNTITLTAQAEQRLGILLAQVALTPVQRKRTVGGEAMLPAGQTITVSAPLAGTLSLPPGGTVPEPGSHVAAGQVVFSFTPLLTAERDVLTPSERVQVAQTKAGVVTAQIEAERQIESAKVTVEVAAIAHARALQLLKSEAGSQRNVDEAAANLKLANEALKTAQARNAYLASIELDEHAGELTSRNIAAPVAGVLQTLDTTVGETVGVGEPLFSVVALDRIWVRVPVYAGQWRDVDTKQAAMVAEFGQATSHVARAAKYVTAPPTANPLATTVDVYYELDNLDETLYPGQKLAVTIPLHSRAESLVIPFKAVLYDIHGGAWVYQQTAEHVYARQRVAVEYVDGDSAILASGPAPGSRIVTDGAAELFGTEFGVGH